MRIYLSVIILLIFASCDARKAKLEKADALISHIEMLIEKEQYNLAKTEIDSLHKTYPMLVEKRRMAVALEDTITRRESSRTLIYCDSILPGKKRVLDSIEPNFRFEKNLKYQDIGNYVYKTELTESNANRTYLKCYVDENADIYLVSNYCGPKIEQQSVEVSVNELFAHTDTISPSDPINHRYDDGGSHFESVIFKNESQNGVIEFINQNNSKKIKVALHGKKSYSYFLADNDRKSIIETYHFWKAKKDVVYLLKEIKKANIRIERIKLSNKSTLKPTK